MKTNNPRYSYQSHHLLEGGKLRVVRVELLSLQTPNEKADMFSPVYTCDFRPVWCFWWDFIPATNLANNFLTNPMCRYFATHLCGVGQSALCTRNRNKNPIESRLRKRCYRASRKATGGPFLRIHWFQTLHCLEQNWTKLWRYAFLPCGSFSQRLFHKMTNSSHIHFHKTSRPDQETQHLASLFNDNLVRCIYPSINCAQEKRSLHSRRNDLDFHSLSRPWGRTLANESDVKYAFPRCKIGSLLPLCPPFLSTFHPVISPIPLYRTGNRTWKIKDAATYRNSFSEWI